MPHAPSWSSGNREESGHLMKTITHLTLGLSALVLITGCQSASYHANQTQMAADGADRLTVGKVQKEIRNGMSSADVVAALGSPNIVTTDEQRRESWVYDKIATTATSSRSEGGIFLLLGGVSGGSGAATTTQRTLTVIIKFDESQKVRDFAYHSSSF
jgi:outer membrane protein assembly factor BamE (lipoprotein component of BamABCDE complex)